MHHFDYVDQQILLQIREDARKPFSQIAEDLKISNSLVHQRIKKLKKLGVINKAEFVVDEKQIGFKTKSYVGIKLREARYAEPVVEGLKKIPEIQECNYVSGHYAIFILIYAFDNHHLRKILYEQVHQIDGVAGTDSFICFDTNFRRQVSLDFLAKNNSYE
ncbi:Lrp/AsnC family transcriptional regulator [Aquimarina sp. 2201CG5-10]|uniref:Lrp/AsnC family transcriptional regulator n=1 Tax=Aquimarina callyspongiae TaxID=3098150 RepID=UPI002AB525C8|nr:Lrp/AsnC ligand binding domain-containing protein [Aquimarina sp. 2201CG5-10]MDY8135780.1 Lrp/AsnC ligand binding domain-containing protein [Aquimarina sp. 2201CG5-10]